LVVLLGGGWAAYHYYAALRPQSFVKFVQDVLTIDGWRSDANGPLLLTVVLLLCSLLCVCRLDRLAPARILVLLYLGIIAWHSLFVVAYTKEVGVNSLLHFAMAPTTVVEGEIKSTPVDRWVHPFTVHWAAATLSAAGAVALLVNAPLAPLRQFRGKGRTVGQKCRTY
jgi:hypothetical protein